MGVTPVFGWPWPDLTPLPADGPAAFTALANAVEATVRDKVVTAYTPVWTGTTANPTNPSGLRGWYRRSGAWCDVGVRVSFTASTGGGILGLFVSLPFAPAASPVAQVITCRTFVPGVGVYHGRAILKAGDARMWPFFPANAGVTSMEQWRSVDATAAAGTGVPLVAASYPILNTGNFAAGGRYKVA